MKKLLLIIPLLLAWACNKQVQEGGFTLRVGVGDDATKTSVGTPDGSKCPTYWVNGDVISINGLLSEPLAGASGASKTESFHFSDTPSAAAQYNVYYPGSNVDNQITLPGDVAPLLGTTTDLNAGVTLHSPAVVVRFTCTGSAVITGLDIQSMNGEKIAGPFSVDGNVLTALSGAVNSFSIDYGAGVQLTQEGKVFTFAIPAGSYQKGLKGILHDNAGHSMTLRFFKNGAVVSQGLDRMANFSAPMPYSAGTEFVFSTPADFESELIDADATAGLGGMDGTASTLGTSIKVGTYNVWAPSARYSYIDPSGGKYDSTVPQQRLWANSYQAVANMINALDCDVIGIQEVTKMVYHTTHASTQDNKDYDGVEHTLNSLLPNYSWVIYNASNTTYDNLTNNTTAAGLGSTDAILYKSSVLTLVSKGRYWLNGTRTKAPQDAEWDHNGTNRPATWAKFTHKASGKQFVFITTHLDLPDAGDTTIDPDNAAPQRRNASELIEWMAPLVAGTDPCVIVGDMNVAPGDKAGNYTLLTSGIWKDVYDVMKAGKALSETELQTTSTMPAQKNEQGGLSAWRPDHILSYGFTPSYYMVNREKLQTRNGEEHWPSDHFPIKVILNF